jgi:hypothetical protein
MPRAVRFYTDEQIDKAVIRGLRGRGVDVLSVPEAGMIGATDDQQFSRAQADGRVMVTFDRDFLAIAATNPNHAGIAFGPLPLSIGEQIAGVFLIHQALEPADMVGRVEYL